MTSYNDLEKRIARLEEKMDIIDEKINSLHNTSMQWVNDALREQTDKFTKSVQETEHRIFDKLEERSTFSRSQWAMLGVAAVGWMMSLGGMLIAVFHK